MSSPGSVQSAAWWLATESLTSDQSGGHSAMTKAERTGETKSFNFHAILFLFLSNMFCLCLQFASRSRVGAAENSLLGSSDLSTIIGPAKGGGFGQVWSLDSISQLICSY